MAKKLLFINACISTHVPSRTRELCETFLEAYKNNPAWEIQKVDLEAESFLPLNHKRLQEREDCLIKLGGADLAKAYPAARDFAAADLIVIGAPYWDLSFPAVLKIYLENIMVGGLTFCYTPTGAQGLCKAERLVYLTTAGGFISQPDWGFGYLQSLAGMLGIKKTCSVAAQGLDIAGADLEKIMARAKGECRNTRL